VWLVRRARLQQSLDDFESPIGYRKMQDREERAGWCQCCAARDQELDRFEMTGGRRGSQRRLESNTALFDVFAASQERGQKCNITARGGFRDRAAALECIGSWMKACRSTWLAALSAQSAARVAMLLDPLPVSSLTRQYPTCKPLRSPSPLRIRASWV
jgi:hypothetical protein